MNLYLVSKDVLELLNALDMLQNQLLEEQKKKNGDTDAIYTEIIGIEDTIKSLDYDLAALAEDITKDIRNNEIEAKAYKEEADRWNLKRQAAEARIKREKELLKYILTDNGVKKIHAGLFNLTVANNGGKMPIRYNCDPMDLPDEFRLEAVSYKPDTDAIRRFLDDGQTSDLFEYGERGTNLRIM